MTSEEAKECLYTHEAVICKGIEYKGVSAIVYRLDPITKKIIVSAELLDKNDNSVTLARLADIERKGIL
jgi:hypothetical protein